MARLAHAVQEREAIRDTIDFLDAEITDHATNPLDEFTVNSHLTTAATLKQEVIEVHKKVISANPQPPDDHVTEYHRLLKKSTSVHNRLHGIKITFPPSTTPATTATTITDVRLPRLELPSFDGNLNNWVLFRDMFSTTIHDNSHISKAQKLTYLKSTLRGEAARLIQSMIISDANYDIAWAQLISRYQNDREILFSILRKFTEQQKLSGNSSTAIRTLIDTSKECIRSLEVLNLPIDSAMNACMMFHVFNKLDTTSKELWEQGLPNSDIPFLDDIFTFLEQRARALAAGESTSTKGNHATHPTERRIRTHLSQTSHSQHCKLCNATDHSIIRCSKFISKQPLERYDTTKKLNLCFNCLREGHCTSDCSNIGRCRTCQRKHHTMIHVNSATSTAPARREPAAEQPKRSHQTLHTNHGMSTAILATAIIRVKDNYDQYQHCRALLDGGSTTSFISELCLQRLRLKRSNSSSSTEILGIASVAAGSARGSVTLVITPHLPSNITYTTEALVLHKITGQQPTYPHDNSSWSHLRNLPLADPHYNRPGGIDILLGADVFYDTLLNGKKKGHSSSPIAVNSTLGWLVAGNTNNSQSHQVCTYHTEISLDVQLRKFWEIESVPAEQPLSQEEAACEQHFIQHVERNPDGRFVVHIPWKSPAPALGRSQEIATKRLKSLERRLQPKPELKTKYIEFMRDYEQQGHMTQLTEAEINCSSPCNYIPHHFVEKESSTSTKLRVVFDASCSTSNGNSLNSTMMVGPVIQDQLIYILMRFRLHNTAFAADVEKMYRQIQVAPMDCQMQRILWREDPTQHVKVYQLNTITYGTAAAPFLATRTLQHIAEVEAHNYPLGSEVIKRDMYVDDMMSGAKTTKEALQIQQQATELLASGGLCLRKWASNDKQFLSNIPENMQETNSSTPIDLGQTVKTLGVYWNTTTDKFHFTVAISTPTQLTKRTVLAEIAKIYDPLGWLAPVLILANTFMQKLWGETSSWDSPLPGYLTEQWKDFTNELQSLSQVSIPRNIRRNSPFYIALAGFCDASERAFSACTYLCCYYYDAPPTTALITSKTRVAPLKTVTLPRLELCGAVLLAQLMNKVKNSLQIPINSIRAWTDSTVTLCWIQSHPNRWKQFVSHRIAEIQQNVPSDCWRHVRGVDNPADCASRGITTEELIHHPLWWEGPLFLKNIDALNSPSTTYTSLQSEPTVKQEERKVTFANIANAIDESIISRFSTFTRLIRVTAWIRRFVRNSLVKKNEDNAVTGPLTTHELQEAHRVWVLKTQSESFSAEIRSLKQQNPLHNKSKILPLNPFIDSHGQLRVGGRLRNAPISPDHKTPLLLPRHHPFTTLLITSKHLELLHAAPQLLLSAIQQQYWIIRGRDAVRQLVRKCIICCRLRSTTMQHIMGNLPSSRVSPSRPFLKCGVDYAGPFTTRAIPGRSKVTFKSYLCIFVCFAIHAVHLEVVSSMTTKAFLAALKRFVSRRGVPSDINSDCGTNFVGANRELK